MKKILILIVLLVLVVACGEDEPVAGPIAKVELTKSEREYFVAYTQDLIKENINNPIVYDSGTEGYLWIEGVLTADWTVGQVVIGKKGDVLREEYRKTTDGFIAKKLVNNETISDWEGNSIEAVVEALIISDKDMNELFNYINDLKKVYSKAELLISKKTLHDLEIEIKVYIDEVKYKSKRLSIIKRNRNEYFLIEKSEIGELKCLKDLVSLIRWDEEEEIHFSDLEINEFMVYITKIEKRLGIGYEYSYGVGKTMWLEGKSILDSTTFKNEVEKVGDDFKISWYEDEVLNESLTMPTLDLVLNSEDINYEDIIKIKKYEESLVKEYESVEISILEKSKDIIKLSIKIDVIDSFSQNKEERLLKIHKASYSKYYLELDGKTTEHENLESLLDSLKWPKLLNVTFKILDESYDGVSGRIEVYFPPSDGYFSLNPDQQYIFRNDIEYRFICEYSTGDYYESIQYIPYFYFFEGLKNIKVKFSNGFGFAVEE